MSFTLDAYAARSCPVKTQNAHLPGSHQPPARLDEGLLELFEGGNRFEAEVVDRLLTHAGIDGVDLRSLRDEPWDAQETACREAMSNGAAVIVGGVLPLDLVGHRAGRADVWLRGEDQDDGRPGYYPVEVKHHRVQERRQTGRSGQTLRCSTLARPAWADSVEVVDVGFRLSSREDDLLQVAHYWRLLEAAGFAAGGTPMAAIVGTDTLDDLGGTVLTWINLLQRQIRTFSRTSEEGWKLRSPLERYDHEHNFRVRVARTAQAQGRADSPTLLVRPIVIKECDRCPWWEVCRPQLDDLDLSLRIDKSPLDVREISVLRARGIQTVEQLAGVNLEEFLPDYLPEVRHRTGAEERLRTAHRRARLVAAGVELERLTSGPIELPQAELEIDLDIETSASDHVYLWGFLVNDLAAGTQRYVAFSRFEDLDDRTEIALAREAMSWLRAQVEGGRSVRVHHYSDYETVRLRRLATRSGDPVLEWAVAWYPEGFVDLFGIMRRHFFGTHGLGLKVVAKQGAGFVWRDDDPGGLNSQRWFDEAVHSDDPIARDAARQRVLEYNEDDVLATAALRRWLRELT